MDIVRIVVIVLIILFVDGFIASKYMDIKNEKLKKAIRNSINSSGCGFMYIFSWTYNLLL